MTKKELIEALAPLKDDAEIYVYCISEYCDIPGFYAHDVYTDDIVSGDRLKNEITIVAHF